MGERDPAPQNLQEAFAIAKEEGACNCGSAMSCRYGCSSATITATRVAFGMLLEEIDRLQAEAKGREDG